MADIQGTWTAFHHNGMESTGYLDSISAFPTDSQTRLPTPHPPPNERIKRRIRTRAKRRRLQGVPPLLGTLGVHQNIPASDTKLTIILGINSISPPLVMDKLIPVNSRVTNKPRLILVTHADHLSRNKTFN